MLVLLKVRVTPGMACKCVTADMCPDGSHVKSTLKYLHPADTLVLVSYKLCLTRNIYDSDSELAFS